MKRAKATCAACATSFSSRSGASRLATLIALDGAGTDTIIAEGLGSRRYEVTRARQRRTFLERLRTWPIPSWRWRASSTASATLRCLQRSEDDFQHRHDSGRNIGEFDSAVGHHARGHALGVGRGTGSAGARPAENRRRHRRRDARPQRTGSPDGRGASDRRPACCRPPGRFASAEDDSRGRCATEQSARVFSALRPTPTFLCRWAARPSPSARAAAEAGPTP